MIINCVDIVPFILASNLDAISSSNIFDTLVSTSLFKCNVLLF